MSDRLVSVAVPVPTLDLLTYRVPDPLLLPPVGGRVVVPLGTRQMTGVVVRVHAPASIDGGSGRSGAASAPAGQLALKNISRVLDAEPFLPASVVELALWVGEYYACGSGEAIAAAMPPGSRRGAETGTRTVRVAALTAAGIEARQAILDDGARGGTGLGPNQRRALAAMADDPSGEPVARLEARGVAGPTLARLARRGLVSIHREPITLTREGGAPAAAAPERAAGPEDSSRELTGEQTDALARLIELADRQQFRTVVLHGVTASGKTELYLRLAAAVLGRNRQVLVLVPEIALTPAVAAAFRAAFGERVAIQHSGLSDRERLEQWQRIRHGVVGVVVGTRSAVFAPLDRPGLIVVDEEHDGSFKQEESPRYNGRDVAVMRGMRQGALVVLGSATPSLETYYNARSGRYDLLELSRRVLDRPLASVRVVNMREEYAERGPDAILSTPLVEALGGRIAAGEQSLVLLNRRGYASVIFCRRCAEPVECPHCSVSLTVHGGSGTRRRLRCHYCGYVIAVPPACPRCASPYMEQAGFGTERIEAELQTAVPGARVARLDRDAARRRGAAAGLLDRFGRGDIDVLIGTQMIAKGHDFPRVTLVGVVSADIGLGLADFRAAERTFQLLTQVVGRAGRGDRPGEAIIQTLYPEHYGIRLACRQDFTAFFEAELRYRRAMRYPPVVALVNGIVHGRTLNEALAAAGDLAGLLRRTTAGLSGAFEVVGPAPAPMVKLRGEHRAQFFLKGRQRRVMREALRATLDTRPDLRRRVTIDVDPLSVL